MIVGTNTKKMEFSINPIIFGKKNIEGWVCFDNEVKKECLEFSLKNEVKPMVEVYKFEDLPKGYEKWPLEKQDLEMLISLSK